MVCALYSHTIDLWLTNKYSLSGTTVFGFHMCVDDDDDEDCRFVRQVVLDGWFKTNTRGTGCVSVCWSIAKWMEIGNIV